MSGQFVQFQEVIAADELCTVNVKADTALLQSISLAPGLPCLTTTDFNKDFLYLTLDGTGGSSDNKILRYPIPGDVNNTPWETRATYPSDYEVFTSSGTVAIHYIHADEDAGYMFFMNTTDRYLYRADLDGSNPQSTTVKIQTMALDRVNQEVYVYNLVSQDIEVYDYDLTLQSAPYTIASGLIRSWRPSY